MTCARALYLMSTRLCLSISLYCLFSSSLTLSLRVNVNKLAFLCNRDQHIITFFIIILLLLKYAWCNPLYTQSLQCCITTLTLPFLIQNLDYSGLSSTGTRSELKLRMAHLCSMTMTRRVSNSKFESQVRNSNLKCHLGFESQVSSSSRLNFRVLSRRAQVQCLFKFAPFTFAPVHIRIPHLFKLMQRYL